MKKFQTFPVGSAGKPWGDSERNQWVSLQLKKRDYNTLVRGAVDEMFKGESLSHCAEPFEYGTVDYTTISLPSYRMVGIRSKPWKSDLFTAVVTGGVHGYETSGVLGELLFAKEHLSKYASQLNILVLPCVSPWGFETVNRWTPNAIDPNRSFNPDHPLCTEAALAMTAISDHVSRSCGVKVHIDLHETTDTDNSEFRPAKFARDGVEPEPWSAIPDGFYLVTDTKRQQLRFQAAMIGAVSKVTHIAPPDENKCIIGTPLIHEGVVEYDCRKLFLCAGHTDAPFVTTTEVYPDSTRTTPEECNRAQAACVCGGLDYVVCLN